MRLPELIWKEVECVGWAYENWVQENFGIEEDVIEEIDEEEEEIEQFDVDSLKPGVNLLKVKTADWKTNDHYAILGLQSIRYKATQKQLKAVHKSLVLKYHPDKLGREATKKDEEAFACITKSADILSDPIKRRAFDSIDPEFDNSIPKGDPKDFQKTFFDQFGPVFERNSRWAVVRSKVQHLGDKSTPRNEVERFYNYWYDFKSWRDYSWEDEEDPEQAQDRYERRQIEKFNRVGRMKLKKEEMARIRKLVDLAWNSDPRIQAFLDEDKRKKDEAKQKKKAEARKYREDIERRQREEEQKKEEEEKAEKERLAKIEEIRKSEAKKEKNATKKERQKFRALAKEDEFWVPEDEQLRMMEQVEFLCTAFNVVKLQDLNEKLQKAEKSERPNIVVKSVEKHKEDELAKQAQVSEKQNTERAKTAVQAGGWNIDDVQLLTKAMVVIPAGTLNRWDVISVWMSEHGATKDRDGKAILKKAKELERQAHRGPMDAQAAFQKYQEQQDKKKIEGKKNTAENPDGGASAKIEVHTWSQDEQKRLEQALRTYGPKEKDRWDKIAAAIPSRTKRDCMIRFKELAEMAKAKKMAMVKAKKTR